jgi:hypothetical protein
VLASPPSLGAAQLQISLVVLDHGLDCFLPDVCLFRYPNPAALELELYVLCGA